MGIESRSGQQLSPVARRNGQIVLDAAVRCLLAKSLEARDARQKRLPAASACMSERHRSLSNESIDP